MMKQNVGVVYHNNRTFILCTGVGKTDEFFSGVVVKQNDESSNHKVGDYSSTWTSGIFNSIDEVPVNYDEWYERFKLIKK